MEDTELVSCDVCTVWEMSLSPAAKETKIISTSVKRVLVVVSSYAPAMPANVHRARMLAWHLKDHGWETEVLSPSAEFQQSVWEDPFSSLFFAPRIPCWHAHPLGIWDCLFRALGMRSASWRGLIPMYFSGAKILSARKFDLVFFSTTAFNLFCLGPIWLAQFGVPYVLDFQDPWYQPGRKLRTTKHWVKGLIGMSTAKFLEFASVRAASGLVSVSPNYLDQLKRRYPQSAAVVSGRCATIPFGAMNSDIANADKFAVSFGNSSTVRTIAYVGVGGVVMQRSFRRFAEGLARIRKSQPDIVKQCRIYLAGTQGGWEEGSSKILSEEATAAGVGDLVTECPRIVSYSAATCVAVKADGLLVFGVDDPAYMPSKLFPYAFTGKPLLACMHWESQVNDYFDRFPDLGVLIHFGGAPDREAEEDKRILLFLSQVLVGERFERKTLKAEHSADTMSRHHGDLFNACVFESSLKLKLQKSCP